MSDDFEAELRVIQRERPEYTRKEAHQYLEAVWHHRGRDAPKFVENPAPADRRFLTRSDFKKLMDAERAGMAKACADYIHQKIMKLRSEIHATETEKFVRRAWASAPSLPSARDAAISHKAFSTITVKKLSTDGLRMIRGVASTPRPDRMNDVVEPLGMTFADKVPLLWQHRSGEPVGIVRFSKPTAEGLKFEATVPKIDEPGRLKDRVDEAWGSILHGLISSVSIGFRALEQERIKDGGVRFIRTEIFELSLVSVPANADAAITSISK